MDEYVFGPESQFWRICREQALLIWGPTTAILQAAHPAIGQGVARYSDFTGDSWGRLVRTLDTVWTIGFGTVEEAARMRDKMIRMHRRIRVDYEEPGTGSRKGTGMDPDLQFWVLATLIQSSVEGYERIHGPLSSRDKNRFLQDMKHFGIYFGLAEDYGPTNWEDFTAYYDELLESGLLGSDPVCREIAQHVAAPPRPHWLRWVMKPWQFLFSELLPAPLNEKLGFRSTRRRRFQMRVLNRLLPVVVPLLPGIIRYPAPYRRALRRIKRDGRGIAAS